MKLNLNNLANLQNETTAVATINDNNDSIETAVENTLSRDGSSPNQMEALLDMNSNHIINLPEPISLTEPLRLQDAATLNGAGTIAIGNLPNGGTTGQVLGKVTNADQDVSWQTVHQLPAGGTAGQRLAKTSSTDYDVTWTSSGTGYIFVSDYGTINDANNTSSVQAAINTAISGGKTLVFDGFGTWNISNVLINGNCDIFISANTVIKQINSSTGDMFAITGTGTVVSFTGPGTIDGNRTNQSIETINHCIKSTGVGTSTAPHTLTVKNVRFKDCSYGALAMYTDGVDVTYERLVVDSCTFVGLSEGTLQSGTNQAPRFITIVDGCEGVVTNSYFDLGYTASGVGASAILMQGTQTTIRKESTFYIAGNTFKNLGRYTTNSLGVVDFYIYGSQVIITGNRFSQSYMTPIRGKSDGRNVVVADNSVLVVLNTQPGISITTTSYGSGQAEEIFTGNVINSAGGDGIIIDGLGIESTSVARSITNNQIYGCGGNGISVNSVTTGNVSNNIIGFSGNNGIVILSCLGVWSVTGNNISNTTGAGISINSNAYLSVSDNILVGPTGTGISVQSNQSGICAGNYISGINTSGGVATGYSFANFVQIIIRNNGLGGVFTTDCSVTGTPVDVYQEGNTWQGRVNRGSAAPASGTWVQGDRVINTSPAAGGYQGFICVVGGTPGTWKGYGQIQA